jgi:hypothetical protein
VIFDSDATSSQFANIEEADNTAFGKAAPSQTYPTVFIIDKVGGVCRAKYSKIGTLRQLALLAHPIISGGASAIQSSNISSLKGLTWIAEQGGKSITDIGFCTNQ